MKLTLIITEKLYTLVFRVHESKKKTVIVLKLPLDQSFPKMAVLKN